MTCPCEANNPQNLRELIKCVEPILFHKVVRPASLGDDTDTPATELQYKNVLLTYEANNHSYLYSSDGVPTFISLGDVNTEQLEEMIRQVQADLATESYNRVQADDNLMTMLEGESEQRKTADAALAEQTTTLQDALTSLDAEVATLQTTTVQKDTTVTADESTITLTKTIGELASEGTTTGLPLPVASADSAGVMNSATYNAVQDNSENIDSILNGAVLVTDLPASPTQDELTTQWKAETGKTNLINRASIYDKSNGKIWYYYTNVSEWEPADIQNPEITVSQATNESLGIVKGSTEDGQVAVEADGSMSLNGYDTLKSDVENLSSEVEGIEVPKVPTYVMGRNASTGEVLSLKVGDSFKDTRLAYDGLFTNTTTGTQGSSQYALQIPLANSTRAGLISPSEKTKLGSLLEIKSLNDSLSLDENGQLSVVGGGSDVNLLDTYTTPIENNDVYNAGYVNSRLNGSSVFLGSGASPINSTTSQEEMVVIGKNAKGFRYGVAVGYEATVNSLFETAVGYNAVVPTNSSSSTALGADTLATGKSCVVLGYGSYTNRDESVSIGRGTATGSGPATRFLANVSTGELDTDATNVAQVRDMISTALEDLPSGGSDVTLQSAYTASPAETDAYDSAYVNGRLDAGKVTIGSNASASTYGVSIGGNASGTYIYQVTIGYGATNNRSSSTIAIGRSAECSSNAADSVAIGSYSYANNDNVVSIGRGNHETAGPVTRRIVNLTAGTQPTDAVNLKQMQDYVAENAGGGNSLPYSLATDDISSAPLLYAYTQAGSPNLNIGYTYYDTATSSYNYSSNFTLPTANQTSNGLLSNTDKVKLDGLSNVAAATAEEITAAWEAA